MTLKYAKPWKVVLYIIAITFNALKDVFMAYILKLFIAFAQKPSGNLLEITGVSLIGIVIFGINGIWCQYLYSNIIQDTNLKMKELSANYLVKARTNHQQVDSSFMTNDLKQIESNRTIPELTIIGYTMNFIAAVIAAVMQSWIVSLMFFIASVVPALVQKLAGPKIETESGKWEKANSHYTNTVNETIAGSNIAKLYNTQNSVISRLIRTARTMEHALKTTNFTRGIANELTIALADCFGMSLTFCVGIYLISIGNITLSTFMMIVQLSNNFMNPVVNSFMYLNAIKTTTPIWQKFQTVVNFREEEPKQNMAAAHFANLQLANAGVKLSNQQIFSDVSLAVKNGEKVLLQAPSGWGKSTLLNVLTGNYQVSSGSYEINGQNASGKWQHDHEFFSFIQQKPFILDDTLKYNITLGREVAETKLNQVASQAGLSDLVKQKGWDYRVGPDGQNLSGGQNQRIEIARALLADRPILLADEATSSLDQDLSQKIHQAILSDFPGTVIEVAHHIAPNEQKLFNRVIKLE